MNPAKTEALQFDVESLTARQQEILAEIVDAVLDAPHPSAALAENRLLKDNPELESFAHEMLRSVQFLQRTAGGIDESSRVRSGTRLGEFELLGELGRGGMGVVYSAWQLTMDRKVALKILPPAASLDRRHLTRFENETRAAGQLQHPNILPVFGAGEFDGVHYYYMPQIDGASLQQVLDASPYFVDSNAETKSQHSETQDCEVVVKNDGSSSATSIHGQRGDSHWIEQVVRWGIEAAEALHYAHESGVVHRDVKPSNLLIDSQAKLWVMDFGLAHYDANHSLTKTGDILGTARYMSPEQASGENWRVDHRADVFSLGVTLFELLSLSKFEAKDKLPVPHATAIVNDLQKRNSAVAYDLETIVLTATAPTLTDRYASAADLADDLRRWQQGDAIQARRPAWTERFLAHCLRHSRTAILAVVLVMFAMGGLLGLYLWTKKQRDDRELALQVAVQHLRETRRVVDDIGARLSEDFKDIPGAEPIRLATLEKTLAFYLSCLDYAEEVPGLEVDAATAAFKIGTMYDDLGRKADAARMYRQSEQLFARDAEDSLERYVDRGLCLLKYGHALVELGNSPAAKDAFEDGQRLIHTARRQAAKTASHPSDTLRQALLLSARLEFQLVDLDADPAEKIVRLRAVRDELLKELLHEPNSVPVLECLADNLERIGDQTPDRTAMIAAWQQAADIYRTIHTNEPKRVDIGLRYAMRLSQLGNAYNSEGSTKELAFAAAVKAWRGLGANVLNDVTSSATFVEVSIGLAEAQANRGDRERAWQTLDESLTHLASISPMNGGEGGNPVGPAAIWNAKGELAFRDDKYARAHSSWEESLRLLRSDEASAEEHVVARDRLYADVLRNVALVLTRTERLEEAAFAWYAVGEQLTSDGNSAEEAMERLNAIATVARNEHNLQTMPGFAERVDELANLLHEFSTR